MTLSHNGGRGGVLMGIELAVIALRAGGCNISPQESVTVRQGGESDVMAETSSGVLWMYWRSVQTIRSSQ